MAEIKDKTYKRHFNKKFLKESLYADAFSLMLNW